MSAGTVPVKAEVAKRKPWQTGQPVVRWLLACATIVLVLVTGGMMLQGEHEASQFAANPTMGAIVFSDAIKSAIEQRLDGAKSLLHASFLVFGILWGVILAKKGEGKLVMGDYQELIMFFGACICFFCSWNSYADYANTMGAIQAQSSTTFNSEDPKEIAIPDFRAKEIEALPRRQYNFFVFALLATGATLVSAHLLKEQPTCPDTRPSLASS